MRKRLRKKLHLGEFQIFGFDMHLKVAEGLDDQGFAALGDALVALVRARGWQCAGTLETLFVYESQNGQKIAELQNEFVAEVKKIPGVVDVHAHEIVDAWSGPGDCDCGCDCGDEECHCGH